MAKRSRGQSKTVGQAITGYAEGLGDFLGHARNKVTSWNSERQELIKHLSEVAADAQKLLLELGHEAVVASQRGRRAASAIVAAVQRGPGRPAGSRNRPRRKRRKMSAEARAKIAAAQKARWARVKAGAKK